MLAVSPANAMRGPYIVNATTGSVRFCWRDTQDHCATWQDLEAGKPFLYEIQGKLRTASTLPLPGGKIRFAAFGDSGRGNNKQKRVAAAVEAYKPQFVVVLGDIVYPRGKDKHYDEKYFDPYRKTLERIPFFPVIGNHDYGNYIFQNEKAAQRLQTYKKIHHRPRYYSFSVGGVDFFSIDTNKEGYNINPAASILKGSDQWNWLEGELRKSKALWKIALMHVPAYSSGGHGSSLSVRAALHPLFKKYGVALVLQGHDHHYERSRSIDGTVYVVAGTGGSKVGKLRKKPREIWSEFTLGSIGFLGVEIQGARLRLEFFDADGQLRDYSEITKLQ